MKSLRHKNLVNLLEVIDDPDDANLYLVMPYCDRGPIVTLSADGTCVPLDIDVARGYMRQITAGLAYLHSKHVAHMDIKPDNILLDSSNRCRLSDFGTSEFFSGADSMQRGLRGTPAFASPEALTSDVFNPFQSDIWSLGVTFYVLLFGRQPFKGETLFVLMKSVMVDELRFDALPEDAIADDYEHAVDLLSLMLSRNPLLRPTAQAIASHPFLSSRGGQRTVNRVRMDVSAARSLPVVQPVPASVGRSGPPDSNEATAKPDSS